MIPVIQKHPMGNSAITNSFKPKETLRDKDILSPGEILNDMTKDGLTPDANSKSKEIDIGQTEPNMEENLIYVVDESKIIAQR